MRQFLYRNFFIKKRTIFRFSRKYRACNRQKGSDLLCNCPQKQSLLQNSVAQQILFGFFVGEAMKKTQGRANPKIIQELLKNI